MPYTNGGIGYQHQETSLKAAEEITHKAPTIREQVYDAVKEKGLASPEQVAEIINRPDCSVKPRFTELKNLGLIEDSGKRCKTRYNKTAILWQITQTDLFGKPFGGE